MADEKAIKVSGRSCVSSLGEIAPISEKLVTLMQIPEALFSIGTRSYSCRPDKTIGQVAASLVLGFPFPSDFAAYGVHVNSKGSNVFCTLVDEHRRVIVTADVRNMYVEEGSWLSFERGLRSALSRARFLVERGEPFRFVVAEGGITRTIGPGPPWPKREDGDSCLVLIYPPGPEMGNRFPLAGDEIVLGRGSDCDVQIDRDTISRRHARVLREDSKWLAEDLDSTNGSYVNDVPIRRSRLRNGDIVQIGEAIFKFLSGPRVEASYREEIYRMTIIDALTGAHNKRYLLEFLEREISRCSRYDRPLAMVMFEIDQFKEISDDHGHLAAERALKGLARRLLGRMRKEELLARCNREELAAVLPECTREAAMHFTQGMRQIVADEPFECEEHLIDVTVSVGVVTLSELHHPDAEDVILAAEEAVSNARRARDSAVD